jgi:serine/threonine-protein kinase SRPK3
MVRSGSILPCPDWRNIQVQGPSAWKARLWFSFYCLALSRSYVCTLICLIKFSGRLTGYCREHEYVALKVFVGKHRQAENEEKVYMHLRSIKCSHPGVKGIRSLRDQFRLPGKYSPHACLVHEPLGLMLKDIREMSEGEKVSGQLLKPIIRYLLMALDFLHTEARAVHTGKLISFYRIVTYIGKLTHLAIDIQEGNIMIGIEDDTIFKNFEEEEWAEPSPRKIDDHRIIYATRQVDIPDNPSHAVLCDFGDARFGEETYIGEVMPDLYRAPEIVLGIPWNEKIDIWSVGLMVSEHVL